MISTIAEAELNFFSLRHEKGESSNQSTDHYFVPIGDVFVVIKSKLKSMIVSHCIRTNRMIQVSNPMIAPRYLCTYSPTVILRHAAQLS